MKFALQLWHLLACIVAGSANQVRQHVIDYLCRTTAAQTDRRRRPDLSVRRVGEVRRRERLGECLRGAFRTSPD